MAVSPRLGTGPRPPEPVCPAAGSPCPEVAAAVDSPGRMIISASRRTDLPAFHGDWFIDRVREGWCEVPNPRFPSKRSRVDLRPESVDCFVFWTRYPHSLMPHLDELDAAGYPYYFLYTLLDYPQDFEPRLPVFEKRLGLYRTLAGRIGAERIVWRYDPIILSGRTPASFHLERFRRIADALGESARRVVFSFLDHYPKADRRLQDAGIDVDDDPRTQGDLVASLEAEAARRGIATAYCAREADPASRCFCVHNVLIQEILGVKVTGAKDRSQRKRCACVVSRDIGVYDTCAFGCLYCYATHGDPARFPISKESA